MKLDEEINRISEWLTALSSAFGVTGCEFEAASVCRNLLSPYVDEISVDVYGNVCGLIRGASENAPLVMLDAHIDQVGIQIIAIGEGGFLRFTDIGLDKRVLPGMEFLIRAKDGKLIPALAVMPYEKDDVFSPEELYLDTGLPEAAVRERISVGDFARFACSPFEIAPGRLCGPAFDDRACFAALLETARRLKEDGGRRALNIAICGTPHEEDSGTGAFALAERLQPSLFVAVDVCHVKRGGKDPGDKFGDGPRIAFGVQGDRAYPERLLYLARAKQIPHSTYNIGYVSGTNAGTVQIAGCGRPTAVISVPLLSMHQPNEIMQMSDILNTGRLLYAFCVDCNVSYAKSGKLNSAEDVKGPFAPDLKRFREKETKISAAPLPVQDAEVSSGLLAYAKKFSEADGVSNFEDAVRRVLLDELAGKAKILCVDNLGCVRAFIEGEKRPVRPIMITAGMDEAGFIVREFTPDGEFRLDAVDGIVSPKLGAAKRFRVTSQETGEKYKGVVAVKAVHLLSKKEGGQYLENDKIFGDLGRDSDKELEKIIKPGDPAVFASDFKRLGNGRFGGKALENRLPMAVALTLIDEGLPYDAWFVFATRSFIGGSGLQCAACDIQPGAALGITAAPAKELPHTAPSYVGAQLGKGAGAALFTDRVHTDKRLTGQWLSALGEKRIKTQLTAVSGAGGKLYGIKMGAADVGIIGLTLPIRNLGSPFETADEGDAMEAVKAAKIAVKLLGDDSFTKRGDMAIEKPRGARLSEASPEARDTALLHAELLSAWADGRKALMKKIISILGSKIAETRNVPLNDVLVRLNTRVRRDGSARGCSLIYAGGNPAPYFVSGFLPDGRLALEDVKGFGRGQAPVVVGKGLHGVMYEAEMNFDGEQRKFWVADIGAADANEARAAVKIGDAAVITAETTACGEMVFAPYPYGMVSKIILLLAGEEIMKTEIAGDVWLLFPTGQASGGAGIRAAVNTLKPENVIIAGSALARNVWYGYDGGKKYTGRFEPLVGCGAVIVQRGSGSVGDLDYAQEAEDLCLRNKIACQTAARVVRFPGMSDLDESGSSERRLGLAAPVRGETGFRGIYSAADVRKTAELIAFLTARST